MKSRILYVFAGFLILWGGLILRAAYLQLIPDRRVTQLQERQFQTVVTLQSRRGAVVDRKGRELALSMTAYSLYADPKLIEGKKQVSKKLAKILGVGPEFVYSKIKNADRRFVWLMRLLSKEKMEKIKEMDIRGLSFVEEYKRYYPNETLLAQTLGLIGSEGQGLEGIELGYDEYLRGNKKKISVRRDARGRPLIAEGMMFAENPDGAELHLTIDAEIQHMLESELNESLTQFEADQAFGVILDAQTSAVVALASAPGFDANLGNKLSHDVRRLRNITDTFEPGSTLKTFAIAAALREKMVAPNTKYNTENGSFKVGDRIIREAEMDHKWPQLTVSEILAYSSNIGTTKIAFDLGEEKIRQALVDFGFGSRTGIDLPGEAKGTLHPLPWNQHLLSNVSFGQGIAVTPLQMANAYAAIANGGVLNTPFIVQSIRDPDTGQVIETKAKKIRRVLSPEESASMRMMLTGVTAPGGTGINAKVDGFLVGGKTGTAQKVNPNGRGYLPKGYISSFAGFIPATDPKFVIFVAVDHPKKNAYYGSQVAAPIFSRVASYAARKEGLAPVLLSEKNIVPTSARIAYERSPSSVVTSSELLDWKPESELLTVPDLKNLSMRDVLRRFSGQDFQIKFVGEGVVAETEPTAGSEWTDKKKITVYLK